MRIKYLTESAYNEIVDNLNDIQVLYQSENTWLDDYFKGKPYFQDSSIECNTFELLNTEKKGDTRYDYINAINLYKTLECLKPNQAANPYLWTYLCHTYCWEYMTNRWPIDDNGLSRIRERYICSESKISLVRNGLSRLWWGAYLSIDEEASDKFGLTKIFFMDQDFFVGIIERDFGMCKNIVLGVLRAAKTYYDTYGKLPSVEVRREWMKVLNRRGAITLLDLETPTKIARDTLKYFEDNK